MGSSVQRGPSVPLQIQQIRSVLLREYQGLIYEKDLESYGQADREQRFLSRALTATAVRIVTGCDREVAGRAVIDGELDQGIDGVAVTDGTQDVWLVQAKWSDQGKGRFLTDAALKLLAGFRLIEQRSFDRFNDRLEPIAARVNSAMHDARLKVTLVVAVMGEGRLTDETVAVLEDARREFNGHGPMLDYRVINAADVLQQIRDDLSPEPVDVSTRMTKWIKNETPFVAYQGTVAAAEIADWYQKHGDRLFSQNIRQSLGRTPVNSGMLRTLTEEPENFWYFNNGLTVLCDSIVPSWPGRRRPDEPVDLAFNGMSVVNGAQTVTAISHAAQSAPEQLEDADVSVRVVSVGHGLPGLARRITETTNTQNHVEQRDFIALEEVQAMIREDFTLSLQKSYVYKRGEADPAPEEGCSVEHAAIALACAHRSPELVVRAKRDTDLLWERGNRGAYTRLFRERPSAVQVWRSVLVHRAVGGALNEERKNLHKRASDIAQRGDLLITHTVFQLIDQSRIDDPDHLWEDVLGEVPALTGKALSWLIHHLDRQYGPSSFLTSTLLDVARCRNLVELVLRDMAQDRDVPAVPEQYRPPITRRKARRPNAVPVLIEAKLIAEGTGLTFKPNQREKGALQEWLAEDPRRVRATWTNDRSGCLVWEHDGHQYSPSGLVMTMYALAGWEEAPVSVQGPSRWTVDGKGTLWDLAIQVMTELSEQE